jgi:hypothetical protein
VNSRSTITAILAAGIAAGAALALYRPILRIGLLSDDYALLMWARTLELLPRDWGQIRPLPILTWAAIGKMTTAGYTPYGLHVFNVVSHGLNAVLVGVLAGRLLESPLKPGTAALIRMEPGLAVPLTAGALFVTMPIAVEPVAWASGVFDVMLATLTLTLAAVVTRRPTLSTSDQILGVLLAIAMLATKETGVIAAPLVLLLFWSRWARLDRTVMLLATAQLLLAAAYAIGRELTGRLDPRLTPRLDLESAGRLIFGIGRAVVLPLHREIVTQHPLLAIASAGALVLSTIAWLVRCHRSPHTRRLAILAVAGSVICVAPAIRIFAITPDLQGTRYVYLASAWWTIVLTAALLDGWRTPRSRIVAAGVACLVIAGMATVTRVHLKPWLGARAERDRVLQRLIALPSSCRQVAATAATDNIEGAYVFRNGLNEALATLGRSFEWVAREQAMPQCQIDLER